MLTVIHFVFKQSPFFPNMRLTYVGNSQTSFNKKFAFCTIITETGLVIPLSQQNKKLIFTSNGLAYLLALRINLHLTCQVNLDKFNYLSQNFNAAQFAHS